MEKKCVNCEGKRVLITHKDGGVEFVDCLCVGRDAWEYKLNAANVPEKYRNFQLDNLSDTFKKENKEDLQIVLDYLEHLDIQIEEGRGLFFQSDPGLAKSSLAAVIVRHALEMGVTCYMGRMSRYISMKFQALRDEEARDFVNWLVSEVDLLVIDEIEKVYMVGDNDAMTEILVSEFFGELYDNKKALIATSNLPRKDLGKLPSHLLDRFDEMITDVVFVGESFRKK